MAPEPTLGWIWPKDPRPGNPSRWPRRWRLFDVLTNRGPDIYVGRINNSPHTRAQPQTTQWSRWEGDGESNDSPFPCGRRGSEKYDFRRRKYQVPDRGTWSWVEYCDGDRERERGGRRRRHLIPRRYWDRNGEVYPAGCWHDAMYGAYCDRVR
ncbi:hypothetical protein ASPWEDRAFT_174649 [Aspergillus wentii DTO 134E9]|uniref:Uncharacterized protein n=1 Tax=Aspergillus wentii DTO 134E9 TaxID=1073089 RepID=A0A1L9RED9_ASPWE|nr:uncharacterized protein ASPWEDRAFT_174649 [Aspergillus wentii DTO 134E9]KAI9933487.1 hypothetical protein MW887_007960 [Aspergillus wentii]OJJ33233.1 hypothetical protein ASPWEDRAFT_174649 [Aspergillus wentii DTO 134E9]